MTKIDPKHCVFCDIIEGAATTNVIESDGNYIIIEPLNPHTPGHALVIPTSHVQDALASVRYAGMTFARAARYARSIGVDCNILTSAGPAATQTVMHLHVHVIPRGPEDGLHHDWPWCRDKETT